MPGLAYVKSQAYTDRFGHRSGRWLVVTTGERRLANMLSQAERGNAKGNFYLLGDHDGGQPGCGIIGWGSAYHGGGHGPAG